MRRAFEAMTDRNLSTNLRNELGGEHEKLILFLLENGRNEEPANPVAAVDQAKELFKMFKDGKTMMGGLSDKYEELISKYLAARSPAQCEEISRAWDKLYPSEDSLQKTIVKRFGGALEEAVLLLMKDPVDIFCKKLHDAMEGIGCNEEVLSRILGGNHKYVSVAIAARYKEKYNQNLREVIRAETGGNYETALLTWLMGSDPMYGLEPTFLYYLAQYSTMNTIPELATFITFLRKLIENMKVHLLF